MTCNCMAVWLCLHVHVRTCSWGCAEQCMIMKCAGMAERGKSLRMKA